jgi:hypothetical protein
MDSSIYLGGLRMGLGGGSTIFRATMGFWGDATGMVQAWVDHFVTPITLP